MRLVSIAVVVAAMMALQVAAGMRRRRSPRLSAVTSSVAFTAAVVRVQYNAVGGSPANPCWAFRFVHCYLHRYCCLSKIMWYVSVPFAAPSRVINSVAAPPENAQLNS